MAFVASNAVYHTTWLAQFFHSFPHVDLSFEKTNANFTPESGKYREALVFWAGIPLIWCCILWLAFLIFFCARCCRRSQSKESQATCPRLCAGLFLVLGCGALGAAFYGNAEVHNGIDKFVDAVDSANKTIENSLGLVNLLDGIANDTVTRALPNLTQAIGEITNLTIRTKIGDLIKKIVMNIDSAKSVTLSMKGNAGSVDTEDITDTTEHLEYFRSMATILVNCVYVVIFLLTFTALLKKSRWMLILVAVMSVIFLLAIWAVTSFYISLGIGTGDLCVDPDSFVMSRVNGTVQQDILQAYIKCQDSSKPYQGEILNAQTAVTQAITALNKTVNMSLPFNITGKISGPVTVVRNNLKFMFGNLSALTTLIGSCDTIHNEYVAALNGVCHTALEGVWYLVLSSAAVGMSSVLMVICAARAWPHYGKRRRRGCGQDYRRVDDSDPFLPSPPPYERNYGTIRQASVTAESRLQADAITISEENQPIITNMGPEAESPPPAYQSGHYMQQYYSLAPTPSSVAQSTHSAA
ncbi:hypothetical protein ACOMHN_012712 [Nucella lapillus]